MQATAVQTRPASVQGPVEKTHPGAGAQDSVVQTSLGEAQAQLLLLCQCCYATVTLWEYSFFFFFWSLHWLLLLQIAAVTDGDGYLSGQHRYHRMPRLYVLQERL
jgi:hypothetical protein